METVKSYWRVALVSTLAAAAVATTFYLQRSTPKKTIPSETNVDRSKMAKQAKTAGNSFFTSKEYEKALEKYTEAIDMMPEAIYYANRAACHLALHNYELALEDCSSAIALDNRYVKAFNRRASALEKLGRKREALTDLTIVCLLENFKQTAMNATERLVRELAQDQLPEIMKQKERMLPSSYFASAYFESFSRTRGKTLELTMEENGAVELESVFINIKQGDFATALQQLSNVMSMELANDLSKVAYNLQATFLFLMGDLQEALEYLEKALALDGNDVDSLIKKATIYMETGNPTTAIQIFEIIEKNAQNHPDLFYHRGQVRFLTGDIQGSVDDYRKCLTFDPNFIYAHIQLGVALYKSGDLGESSAVFAKAQKKFSKRYEPFLYNGEIMMDMNRLDEGIATIFYCLAQRLFEKASDMSTMSPLPLINLAVLEMRRSDVVKAEECCRKALEIDPHCDLGYNQLAQVLLAQDRIQEAVNVYNDSITFIRTEPELLNILVCREASLAQLEVSKIYPTLLEEIKAAATAQA